MAQSKVLHGARAILNIGNVKVGIFTSVSYQVGYDVQPAYLLGRFSPGELVYTGAEVVTMTCQGFRVLEHGGLSIIPTLNDLLEYEDINVTLVDRVTGSDIMTVMGCKPVSFSSNVSSRSIQDQTVTLQGLIFGEEGNMSEEGGNATELPV